MLGQVEGRTSRMLIHRRILGVTVVRKMSAGPIKLQPADVRSVHGLVAALEQLLFDERLEDAAHGRAFWHPKDESAPGDRADGEEAQLLAEHAMIAFLALLELVQVGVQLLL